MTQAAAIADVQQAIADMLAGHSKVHENLSRAELVTHSLNNREAITTINGGEAVGDF